MQLAGGQLLPSEVLLCLMGKTDMKHANLCRRTCKAVLELHAFLQAQLDRYTPINSFTDTEVPTTLQDSYMAR